MGLVTRPNGSSYFASHPSIDPDLGALIDAELNLLFDGMNSIDNANIDGTPKISASKIDLSSGGYVEDAGDEITGILQHIFDTVSGQSFWRAMRASGNARIYEGVADGLWCISQNTYYTGSAWSGRDTTGVCWALKLESDGFHVYYAASASSGVVPSWTEVFHVNASGYLENEVVRDLSVDWVNAGGLSQGIMHAGFESDSGPLWLSQGTDTFPNASLDAGHFNIYIPANANNLEYYMLMNTSGTSNIQARLEVSSTYGTILSSTAGSPANPDFQGPGTLDISALSGWTEVEVNVRDGAGTAGDIWQLAWRII